MENNFSPPPATDQSYNWTVPDLIGDNLAIEVRDKDNPSVSAKSTAPFGIKGSITVDYPNATSGNWTVDSPENISWTPTGTYPSNVKIEY